MDISLKQLIKRTLTEELEDPEQEDVITIINRFKKDAEEEDDVASEEEEQVKLAKEQRKLSKCVKGSNNRNKQRRKVALRIHSFGTVVRASGERAAH